VIDRRAGRSGIQLAGLHAALADGSAMAAVTKAEMNGRKYGVHGTPAWLLAQGLITGLRPAAEFEHQARLGRMPRLVAADAAFYSARNEAAAKARGVERVCIPIAPPKVPNAGASRRSAGSATARNGAPDARDASA
jgi:hypothetical protein